MVGFWHHSHPMSDYDRFNLRFPPGMREQLEEAAKKANRSLHAEILERLRVTFEVASVDARLTALEQEVAVLKKGKK